MKLLRDKRNRESKDRDRRGEMGKKRPSRRRERRKTIGVQKSLAKDEAAPSAHALAEDRPEWLPSDWKMEVRKRRHGVRADRVDNLGPYLSALENKSGKPTFILYYICPISGDSLRSKPEVLRYLSLSRERVEASKCRTSKISDSGEWHSSMAGHGSEYSKQLRAALEDNPLEWLPTGWILEIGTCMNGVSENNYKCYFNILTGSRFYSKEEVLRYLEAHKLSGSTSNMEGSANANAMDFHISSEKGNTHMECPHNVLAEIDCFPSELPHGWIKEIRITKTRTSQQIRRDSFYIDMVTGFGFRSKRDVFRHLENKATCKLAFRLGKSHLPKLRPLKKEATYPISARRPKVKKTAVRRHLFSRQIAKCDNICETSFSASEDFNHLGKENAKLETENQPQESRPTPENVHDLQKENGRLETESQSIQDSHIEEVPGHSPIRMQLEAASDNPSGPVMPLEDKSMLVQGVTPSGRKFKLDVIEPSTKKKRAAKPLITHLRVSKRLAGVEADSGIEDSSQRAKETQSDEAQATLDKDSNPNCGPRDKAASESEYQVTFDGKWPPVELANKEHQVDPHMELPFGDSWADPCIVFAFKTLTSDLPVLDENAAIQDYFRHQNISTQSPGPSAQPAKLPSDKTSINDDRRP